MFSVKYYGKNIMFDMISKEQFLSLITKYVEESDINNNANAHFDTYEKAHAFVLNKKYEMLRQSKKYCELMHDTPKDNAKNCLHMDVEFLQGKYINNFFIID